MDICRHGGYIYCWGKFPLCRKAAKKVYEKRFSESVSKYAAGLLALSLSCPLSASARFAGDNIFICYRIFSLGAWIIIKRLPCTGLTKRIFLRPWIILCVVVTALSSLGIFLSRLDNSV